ncbi:MAG: hypothetical protein FJ319_08200 [SAR202 cluster bacterium]|nr:hypothetical protein [SAR202 cluster bacterium]
MKRWIMVSAVGALALAASVACSSGGSTADPTATSRPAATSPTATTAPSGSQANEVRITMGDVGGATKKYAFVPATLNFTVGQAATLVIHSETEFHTFTSDDLKLDVEVDAGKTVNKAFTFDKAGTFKVVCIPHEALGMVGEIVVK